jgi:hypothetical protein
MNEFHLLATRGILDCGFPEASPMAGMERQL